MSTPMQSGAAGDPMGETVSAAKPGTLRLRITKVLPEAERVISIEVAREDGARLPAWEPGAHVDVHLPSGQIRQYSLCGDPESLISYRFAVLREAAGRGGSIELHKIARSYGELDIGLPRNRFALRDSERFLFLAGGIGITPLLSMVKAAERRGVPWTLIHGGRTLASMAFTAELKNCRGGNVRILPQDQHGHPDFESMMEFLRPNTLVYACGPAAMLAAIEAAAAHHGVADRLHVERFSAAAAGARPASEDRAFDVVLQRSGRTLYIPADRTMASVLQEEGADVPFSCEEGSCGTCETRVLSGIPDHRDVCLTEEEKAPNDRMIVCVGRALSATLVLDAG